MNNARKEIILEKLNTKNYNHEIYSYGNSIIRVERWYWDDNQLCYTKFKDVLIYDYDWVSNNYIVNYCRRKFKKINWEIYE